MTTKEDGMSNELGRVAEYAPSDDERSRALMRIMLRADGYSWDEEHSEDGGSLSPEDLSYMQAGINDVLVALDMLNNGANEEQVEATVCDGEPFFSFSPLSPAPQVVETVAELEALAEGVILHDAGGDAIIVTQNSDGERWYASAFSGGERESWIVDLPATVLYPHPTPDEGLCYGADGVTDQKCPVCVRADVLAEVSGFLSWLVSLDDTVAGLEERRTVTLSTIIGKARTILDAAPGEQDD